jgi:hypothetical protein
MIDSKYMILSGAVAIILSYLEMSIKGEDAGKKTLELIVMFLAATFLSIAIVVMAATLGPFIFQYCTNYIVETPYKITASEITNYTLEALLVILIGFIFANRKL